MRRKQQEDQEGEIVDKFATETQVVSEKSKEIVETFRENMLKDLFQRLSCDNLEGKLLCGDMLQV